jgi:hypothetical protein
MPQFTPRFRPEVTATTGDSMDRRIPNRGESIADDVRSRKRLPRLAVVIGAVGGMLLGTLGVMAQPDSEGTDSDRPAADRVESPREEPVRASSRERDPTGAIEASGLEFVTPPTQQAIDRGLAWLALRQQENGSWGGRGMYHQNAAVTALAGMAFLSAGHVPGQGQYGVNVERAAEFLMENTSPAGFIHAPETQIHGPMYEHGFATLFLAEVYGMSPSDKLRDKLKAAVDLIVSCQNREGGWRYQAQRRDADVSVTVCQIMALRAARNAGIAVPKETVDDCIEYVKKCQNSDGGFRYQLTQFSPSAFARSAAGLVALYSAGIYEGREVEKALRFLSSQREQVFRAEQYYFYGHYYAVQAMWHAGDRYWRRWYPAIRDELISLQLADGSWNDVQVCPEYGTAMACIILQMPNNYLPIFQR